MIRTAAAIMIALAVLACSDDADGSAAPASSTTEANEGVASTTAPPDYTGDPDSAFCAGVLESADRPLLDPFAAGIDGRELELRIRALVLRFAQLAEQAPEELADDLSDVAAALDALDEALAGHDYDLGAAGDAGVDRSVLDDPRFVDVATRVAAYTRQVCGAP